MFRCDIWMQRLVKNRILIIISFSLCFFMFLCCMYVVVIVVTFVAKFKFSTFHRLSSAHCTLNTNQLHMQFFNIPEIHNFQTLLSPQHFIEHRSLLRATTFVFNSDIFHRFSFFIFVFYLLQRRIEVQYSLSCIYITIFFITN